MTSYWAAVGAETDPLRRARQLQRSWEHLIAEGGLGPELSPGSIAGLRPTIVESWQRSLAARLDPTDLLAPIEADESEVLERWFEHPLGSLPHVCGEQLRKVAEESSGVVVVTDASGLVLHRVGDEWLKERAAEMNLVEGAGYSEAADGTNGIGTALAADRAFQVFAFEHFNERHHEWVCSGAPVHDPLSGRTIGLIDLSSLWTIAHPRSLKLVTAAARTIDQCLVDARRDRDARLRRRYSDFMTRRTDLLVGRDGYLLDGAEAHPSRFDIPEGGGEVVLADGSIAVAAPLGRGEAYLLRQVTTRHAKSAPVEGLERAEKHVRELATEQAALRQVATLVARESSPDQLFAVVAEQVARMFDVPHVRLVRYEPDGSVVVGGYSEGDHRPFPIGSRWPLDSPGVVAAVRQTGRSARTDDYVDMTGEIAAVVRGAGMRAAVASPIVVERHLWGAMVVLTPRQEPLPEDTEARLTDFSELVATAIANAESRQALAELADEQAALRRVATLVAQEVPQAEVFSAIAEEIGRLLRIEEVRVVRYDDDRAVVVGGWGWASDVFPFGAAVRLEDDSAVSRVFRTGQSVRIDDYATLSGPVGESARSTGVYSVVATPISVGGRVWGAITAGVIEAETLPPHTEFRLEQFTELIATAIGNAEARGEVERLAEEQGALGRVATMVAQGLPGSELFRAVAREVGALFGTDFAGIGRFEADAVIAVASSNETMLRTGTRWEIDDVSASAQVYRTGRSVRVDAMDWSRVRGPLSEVSARLGVVSTVASPIIVDGRTWGAVSVSSTHEALPPDTEARLASFTELVATAIANAESSAELAASRTRIAAAADDERRRVVRDLHDGAQQRLVHTLITLKLAQRALRDGDGKTESLLAEAVEQAEQGNRELRDLAHGILPAVLTRGGLRAGVDAVVARLDLPVQVDVPAERLPAEIEASAYFIVAEALTNVVKHSRAESAKVTASVKDGSLRVEVRDDGIGGADPAGHGLVGLADRATALGGRLEVESPASGGTVVTSTFPV